MVLFNYLKKKRKKKEEEEDENKRIKRYYARFKYIR